MHRRGGHQQPSNMHPMRYMEVPPGDPFQDPSQGGTLQGQSSRIGLGHPPFTHAANIRPSTLDTPTSRNAFGRSTSLNAIPSTQESPAYNVLNTPRPTNRYQSSARTVEYHYAQYNVPTTQTQLDRLIGMVQTLMEDTRELKQDNQQLKARVSSLEASARTDPPTTSSRGIAARRARSTQMKARSLRRRGRQMAGQESDESDIDPALRERAVSESSVDTDTGATDYSANSESDAIGDDGSILAPADKKVLQKYTTKACRRYCHVEGNDWPDPTVARTNPITHQTYPTPFFQFDVSDTRNEQIIKGVARLVAGELENPKCWPAGLQHLRESGTKPWDDELIVDLSKASYRSLKRGWSRSNNAEAALKAEIQDRSHRHSQRRLHKSEQILKVVDAYAAQFDIDPEILKEIINAEYLSDEVSGPEDESVETKEVWKVRMAAISDMSLEPNALKKLHFLEILQPGWRSDSYSNLIHELEDLWFSGLSAQQKKKITYYRVPTNRISTRIPLFAPYNFGIKAGWLEENRTDAEKRSLLKDWGKYPEPEGCGLPHLTTVVGEGEL
ncbi:hypothetical protein B0H13DRAFT_2213170 [Mycena leptocephala]|nr:hypothetical protein B0H13DRAFT_2213170 [Mycena leptocephala]